jgi:hypothetical protein
MSLLSALPREVSKKNMPNSYSSERTKLNRNFWRAFEPKAVLGHFLA